MWTKIMDIEHEDGYQELIPNEIFYKGDMMAATFYCVKRGYRRFTLERVDTADESDPEYVKWMEMWKNETRKN